MVSSNRTASEAAKPRRLRALIPNLALSISVMAMTAIFSPRTELKTQYPAMALGVVLAGIICFFIAGKYNLLSRIYSKQNKPMLILSAVLTATLSANNAMFFHKKWKASPMFPDIPHRSFLITAAAVLGGIAALFAIFTALYAFIRWFSRLSADFVRESDKCEKVYFITAGLLISAFIAVVFSLTNMFFAPTNNGKFIPYDVVYTTDSPFLIKFDTFLNISSTENDLRQPLFGVFAAPFAAAAKTIANQLTFIPNIYVICLSIIQALLLLISNIMTARLLDLKGPSKALYLGISSVIYPVLLYSLCPEQYIFSVFWTILFIYLSLRTTEDNRLSFIGAAGSLLTTGVLFPLLVPHGTLKERFISLLKTFAAFVAFIVISGGTPVFCDTMAYLTRFSEFSGAELTFGDKLLQFINFAVICFVSPSTGITTNPEKGFIAYSMNTVSAVNYAGLAILALAALGFILNRKNAFARVCACWAAFSFVMLCVLGWGTAENGLILYSLYFSWAYLGLLVMLAEKLFARIPAVKYAVYAVGIAAMLAANASGLYELIRFGMEYYPL